MLRGFQNVLQLPAIEHTEAVGVMVKAEKSST